MPRLDGTGPYGTGPISGVCRRNIAPNNTNANANANTNNANYGRGLGLGLGARANADLGQGIGLGRGCRGGRRFSSRGRNW